MYNQDQIIHIVSYTIKTNIITYRKVARIYPHNYLVSKIAATITYKTALNRDFDQNPILRIQNC